MITVTREILYRTLRAVMLFVCEDETRFHLTSVYFDCEGDGLRVVATDGHTMTIAYPIVRGKCYTSLILRMEDAEALLKLLKYDKKNGHLEIAISLGETFNVAGADIAFERKPLAEKYIPWRAVVPERGDKTGTIKSAPGVFGLSPAYVGRAGIAAKYFGWDPKSSKALEVTNLPSELEPLRLDIDVTDTGTLTMVIMPMRI
jgi:hypothetical protein